MDDHSAVSMGKHDDTEMRFLAPEIHREAGPIVDSGKFDDAIFAAFRYLEGVIQERIGSKSIGAALLDEAFDGPTPRIRIGRDHQDQNAIKSLFVGALGNIRNDRGHKKAPFLPCPNRDVCLAHLAFGSLLLHLLGKDRNIFPRIRTSRVFGSPEQPRVELAGENFGSDTRALAGGVVVPITRRSETLVEVALPARFSGPVALISQGNESDSLFCDARLLERAPEASYEVLYADIQLYSDDGCTIPVRPVVGLLLKVVEGHKEFERISPVQPGLYRSGQFVSHGPFLKDAIGETWFRDPRTGRVRYAWRESLVAAPNVVGDVRDERIGGIVLLPAKICAPPREQRTLRVIASIDRGFSRLERDVTPSVKWRSENSRIAHVERSVVYAKIFGRARIECEYQGHRATAEVFVEHTRAGDQATYFQGVRGLQKIRFDGSDNLFLCNQSGSVFMISASGGFEEAVRITSREEFSPGIDCIAVTRGGDILANDMERNWCLRCRRGADAYSAPETFATAIDGPKKGITEAPDGTVFVAVMGRRPGEGFLLRVDSSGREDVFPTKAMALDVACGPSEELFLPASDRSIHVYSRDVAFLRSIPHGINDSATDIAVDSRGRIFVSFFHSGIVACVREASTGLKVIKIVEGLSHPCGIALDSRGRLFVAEFGGNRIEMLTLPDP